MFVLGFFAHIGFSRVASQKLALIVSSGTRGSSISFPFAFHSPHSDTYLHRLSFGMCVSDRLHTVWANRFFSVGAIFCKSWLAPFRSLPRSQVEASTDDCYIE